MHIFLFASSAVVTI